jgi:hypothetical protein
VATARLSHAAAARIERGTGIALIAPE